MKRKKNVKFIPPPKHRLTDEEVKALEQELIDCGERPTKILRAKVIRDILSDHAKPSEAIPPIPPSSHPQRTNDARSAFTDRSQAKRESILNNVPIPPRTSDLDICTKCNQDRIVDKELAKRTCPKCGDVQAFSSDMFDVSEEGDYVQSIPNPPSAIPKTHRTQFHKTQPMATRHVLETLHTSYQKFHMVDPSARVQTSRTQAILKAQGTNLPATYRNAPLRLSKELTAAPILLV